jgi:hypothetical protein
MTKAIYEDIYQGNSDEAKEKFPFIKEGIHFKVLCAISTNIAIFPKEESFYVVTFNTGKGNQFNVSIEETNSIKLLNTIIKRESYDCQYLDDEDIPKVTKFLEDNNCKYIMN